MVLSLPCYLVSDLHVPCFVVFALILWFLPLTSLLCFALTLLCGFCPLPYFVVVALALLVVSDLPCYVVLDPNGLSLLTA